MNEPEILCANCDREAKDYFGEKGLSIPAHFYEGMIWYCSVQCHDEKTEEE